MCACLWGEKEDALRMHIHVVCMCGAATIYLYYSGQGFNTFPILQKGCAFSYPSSSKNVIAIHLFLLLFSLLIIPKSISVEANSICVIMEKMIISSYCYKEKRYIRTF